ncbi:MAG: 50S ribosomal protein L23 [Planctomycetota bacterium]|jgi:large subunit ribosomal protein L23
MPHAELYYGLIDKPVVTEKSAGQQESANKYSFRVAPSANKSEIAKAVATLFGVKVAKVNVMTVPGKFKRVLGRYGQMRDWKKAIVTLAPGESIAIV